MLINWCSRDHYSYYVNGQRLFIFSGEVCKPNSFPKEHY